MSTTPKGRAAAPVSANSDREPEHDDGPPESEHPDLPSALLQAQRLIAHGVGKSGEAKVETRAGGSYSYKYTSGEDMMAGAREVLLAVGLLWTLESYSVIDEQGSDLPLYSPTFLLEHPSSGAIAGSGKERRYTFPIPISMAGAADKALAGARTYATSYALRDVLLIPRPDANEPDKRARDEGVGSWRTRRGDKPNEAAAPSQQPAAPRKPSPAEIAYEAMNAAWRDYLATARAHGQEPNFATIYRQAIGKAWPGSASKADGGDMAKAAAEIKRLAALIGEAARDDAANEPDRADTLDHGGTGGGLFE